MQCNVMQACSRKNYNMVSSVGKSGQNNYSVNSTTMPMKIDSPPATVKQIVHSKVPNGGAVSPPSSPQRVTRSRIHGQKEELKTTTTTKTLGASSNDVTSVTTSQERVVCPELAINYANTVISSRLGSLNSKQAELESKMARLSERLRHKQLQLTNSHARKQLDFYEHNRSRKQNSLVLLTTDVLSEVEVDHAKALPVQVDGASEDKMAKPELNVPLSPVKAENSFCSSLESSFQSSFQEDISLAQIAGRLEFSRQMVDEDVTDCSSDEEAETELLLQSNERYVSSQALSMCFVVRLCVVCLSGGSQPAYNLVSLTASNCYEYSIRYCILDCNLTGLLVGGLPVAMNNFLPVLEKQCHYFNHY